MRALARAPTRAAAVVLATLAAAPASAQHAWSYKGEHGPDHWAEVSPQYATCKVGKHQSPIDIRGASAADLPAVDFSYAPAPLEIVDNGHTIEVDYAPGSFITVGGKRYDLVQFHFHHPSEERIAGQPFPLVAHLVHRGADGKLAVVAVLFKEGAPNPVLEGVWEHLPAGEGPPHVIQGATVDASRLLPADHRYYTFTGSLTTPPCTEDVTWFVLATQVELSKAQEATFAARYPSNARPVQPLNGREVRMSR